MMWLAELAPRQTRPAAGTSAWGRTVVRIGAQAIAALEADYRIVLVDLPGFGYSDKPAKNYPHRLCPAVCIA